MDSSQETRKLAGHFGRDKMGAMVVSRWYFPHIFKHVTEMIKYCDACQHITTYKLQQGQETTSPPSPCQHREPDQHWYNWSTERN